MPSAKSILILGATRGIGLGLVQQALILHPEATIFATARDPANAPKLAAVTEKSNGRVKVLAADAVDSKSIKLLAKEVMKTHKSMDIVIFNAGALNGFGNMLDVGINGLKENLAIHVYGAYDVGAAFSPLLLRSTYPRKTLVFVSTIWSSLTLTYETLALHEKIQGATGYDATAFYNVSKTALNQLAIQFDHILRPQGVPVIILHPGLVLTDQNPYVGMSIDESGASILKTLDTYESAPGRIFIDNDGNLLPW